VTPAVVRRLLLQLDDVVEARCEITSTCLTIDLTTTAETIRLTLDADTGRLWTQANAQTLLDRVRPLLAETGGALLQERVVQTLRALYGSRAAEVPTGGTARRVTLRL
jgi:hypothetical protein